MLEELPGYIYLLSQMGGKPLCIEDETHAAAFTTCPSSTSRDMVDAELGMITLSDGSEIEGLTLSNGWCFRFVDELPVFDSSVNEVALYDSEAQWFLIGDDVAGSTIIVDRPEESTIYVYNKYHEVVYSTHMIGASNEIPLPSGGYIMFIGHTGDTVTLG